MFANLLKTKKAFVLRKANYCQSKPRAFASQTLELHEKARSLIQTRMFLSSLGDFIGKSGTFTTCSLDQKHSDMPLFGSVMPYLGFSYICLYIKVHSFRDLSR